MAAYTEILMLGFLRDGPKHGYELKRSMERVLAGARVTNSQLYPSLKRFEEMGAVTRQVTRQIGKPDRHSYQLTSLGEEILHDLLIEDTSEVVGRDREFYVRAAHFALLSAAERLAVLEARKSALLRRQAHVAAWGGGSWPKKVGRLRGQMLATELAVLDQWLAEEQQAAEGEDGDGHGV